MPVLAHRFRLRFSGIGAPSDRDVLTAQVVKVKMDFKSKHVEFEIQQPAMVGQMMEVVNELVAHPGTIAVEIMDGGEGVSSRIEFTSLECISHEFALDYAKGTRAVNHKLVMKYRQMYSV